MSGPDRSTSRRVRVLLTCVTLSICSSPSSAHTLTVSPDGSADFLHPQPAIQASANGDTVLVFPGHYDGRVFFAGKRIVLRSQDGPDVTILDANGTGSVVTMAFGQGAETVVDGFTLTGGIGTPFTEPLPAPVPELRGVGDAENGGGKRRGGALFLQEASPTLRHLIIRGNHADIGGGIWMYDGAPVVSDCTITDNYAGKGGAIGHETGSAGEYRRVVIENNLAVMGGGAALILSHGLFDDCRFDSNQATEGGGLYVLQADDPAIVTNCLFVRNNASEGSAISVQFGSLRLESSTIANHGPNSGDLATVLFRSVGSYSLARNVFFKNRSQQILGCQGVVIGASCCLFWPDLPPTCNAMENTIAANPGFCGRDDFRVTWNSICLPENSPFGCGRLGADLGECPPPALDIGR